MATTTTTFNAQDVNIMLDDESDVLVDISGSANEASIAAEQEIGEYRVFEDRWMQRIDGGLSVEISLVTVYSSAEEEAVDLLKEWFFINNGGPRTMQVDVPSAMGGDRYSGEFRLADLNIPLEAAEAAPISVEATLQSHGAITLATVVS